MIVLAVVTKFIAAWLTQKTFKLSNDERQLIFGLTTARVGATLAVVLVGYNVILGETPAGDPIRLLNEDVLNGTIIMILVTCTISSFLVEKASRKIAFTEDSKTGGEDAGGNEKILLSLAYPETINDLVDFGLMLKSKSQKTPVYALHVVAEEQTESSAPTEGKKMLQKAIKHAMATDNTILPLTRFDYNISNGIVYTIREHNITDIVIGLHHKDGDSNDFFGPIADKILRRVHETVYIYKATQPFNTLKRIVVVVPLKAELEPGFLHWFNKLYTSSKETGLPLVVYGHPQTVQHVEEANQHKTAPLNITYNNFTNWDDFLIFSRDIKPNDLFIIVSSRRGHTSYHSQLDKLPYHLSQYFDKNSFILLYPKQLEHGYGREDVQLVDTSFIETISDNMNVFKKLSRLFKK
jgi:nucleotide-binding universal stress UspA family protein